MGLENGKERFWNLVEMAPLKYFFLGCRCQHLNRCLEKQSPFPEPISAVDAVATQKDPMGLPIGNGTLLDEDDSTFTMPNEIQQTKDEGPYRR